MRRALVVLASLGCLAGLPAPAPAACIAAVEWRDVLYPQVSASVDLPRGRPLRDGEYPACDDHIVQDENGRRVNPVPRDTPADLERVAGVSAYLAVAVRGQAPIYVAPGFLTVLATHPLRAALHPGPGEERCSGGHRVTRSGEIAFQPLHSRSTLTMRRGARETTVSADARTRVIGGARRAGQPYFDAGDRLVVTGRRCGGPETGSMAAETIRLG